MNNRLKKFFSSIVTIFFIMVIVCVLSNGCKWLLESPIISLIIQMDNDFYEDIQRSRLREGNIFTQWQGTKSCLLNHVCIVFKNMVVCSKFLNVFLDQIKERLDDIISKLMHQSDNLLNRDLITNTTTVMELKIAPNKKVYWVIQLGALKNFKSVSEIVTKLKMYNYPVYILPESPIPGELVRVFVGPDLSKEKLEYMLNDLYNLSHLRGKVCLYKKN